MCRNYFRRLFELSDLLPQPVPAGFAIPALNQTLLEPGKREYFEKTEIDLQGLDGAAWASIKEKLKRWPKARTHEHRVLEPLYEILNEAKGYNYLKRIGCLNVQFVSVSARQNEKLRIWLRNIEGSKSFAM